MQHASIRLWGAIASAALASMALAQTPKEPPSPVLVGVGGALKDDNRAIYQALLGAKESPRIVIVPFASADSAAAGTSGAERFHAQRPAAECLVMPDSGKGEPEAAAAAAMLERADLVYFTGGDQSRLIPRFYEGAGKGPPNAALLSLRAALARGAVVAGTSAGCAVLSDPMFTGGGSEAALAGSPEKPEAEEPGAAPPPDARPAARGVQLGRGLGLVPGVIMDSHFLQRGRVGRMVAALEKAGLRYGVGVNENRAVRIEGRTFRGIGDAAAVVVDIGGMRREGASRLNVRLTLLGDGTAIILAEDPRADASRSFGCVEFPGGIGAETAQGIEPPRGAWERNGILSMLRLLAADPSTPQRAPSDHFEVVISADEGTSFHWFRRPDDGPPDPATLAVWGARMDILEHAPDTPAPPPAHPPARSP